MAEAKACSSGGPATLRVVLAQLVSMASSQWPLLLGNVVEWYEFSIYGYLAEQMKANFFSGSALATWSGFAVTFLARPLGGLLFGLAGDRYGRRPATLLSLCGMLFATVGQGCLPVVPSETTWDGAWTAGNFGLYLLIALRLVQGISAGGEEGSLVALLVESAPREHKALAAALFPATGFCSFLLSSGVSALLASTLGPRELGRWGWRLPFLASLPAGLVALWGRSWVVESEDFLRQQRATPEEQVTSEAAEPAPCTEGGEEELKSDSRGLRAFVREHWQVLLLGNAATVSQAILFYAGNVWVCSYLKGQGMEHAKADLVGFCSNLLSLLVIMPLAYLCDRVGVGTMAVAAASIACVIGMPNFAVLQAFPGNMGVALLCIPMVNGLAAAVSGSCMFFYCSELFPTRVRALGFGLTFNFATTFFGGFAGVACEALLRLSPLGPGMLISAAGLTSALSMLAGMKLRARGSMQLTHMRHEPYWVLQRDSPVRGESSQGKVLPPVLLGRLNPNEGKDGVVEEGLGKGGA